MHNLKKLKKFESFHMNHEFNAPKKPTYHARTIRLYVHLDWYLHSTLSPEGEGESWKLEEIQEKLHTSTGIKPRISTILSKNAQFFQKYQCSPLRRVDKEQFTLDPVYFLMAGQKVRPPPSGPGRPRKKYTKGDQELDVHT